MGSGSFDRSAYSNFTASVASKPTSGAGGIFSASGMDPSLDPHGVKVRESRDSADSPKSTPITIAIDVTGSMGILADTIVRKGIGVVVEGILERKPVSNPHLQLMAIGDVHMGDRAPLQVTQYEADNRIVEQTTKIFLEHGGGGNGSESYHLAWYFAAFHIEHDSIEKRGKRGYLFTVGDELPPPALEQTEIHKVTGDTVEK